MSILKKEARIFITIWTNLFIVFLIIHALMPSDPVMSRFIAILYLVGNSMFYATILSGVIMVFYYVNKLLIESRGKGISG